MPLGMVQFSPDTSPDRQVTTGSGYDYADTAISGFSLTHLSGSGCAIYGDVPILPMTGAVPADPETPSSRSPTADESGHGRQLCGRRRVGVRSASGSDSPPPPGPPSAPSPSPALGTLDGSAAADTDDLLVQGQ